MRTSNPAGRLMLVLIVAIGISVLWTVAGEMLWGSGSNPPQLIFRADGTPLLQTFVQGRKAVRFDDLEGHEVPLQDELRRLSLLFLEGPDDARQRRNDGAVESFVVSDARNPPTYWSLVFDRRTGLGYFAGYNSTTNLRMGYLGTRGFQAEDPRANECFAFDRHLSTTVSDVLSLDASLNGDLPDRYSVTMSFAAADGAGRGVAGKYVYVLTQHQRVYQIDLKERAVRVVYEAPMISGLSFHTIASATDNPEMVLALRTGDEIVLLDGKMQVSRKYKIPKEAAAHSLTWGEVSPGHALAHWSDVRHVPPGTNVERIVWFDDKGNVERRETASFAGYATDPAAFAMVAPSPVVSAAAIAGISPWVQIAQGRADDWSEGFRMSWNQLGTAWVAVQLLAAALAVATWRRETRYATPKGARVLWSLVVLAGGVPAWIAYRCSCRWPTLERCPTCGVATPRDRVPCARCRVDLPRPAMHGTEILAA